jgi:hypothetical protein
MAADDSQQAESHPVVVVSNQVNDGLPYQPAQNGHQGLKKPEGDGGAQDLKAGMALHGDAAAEGYGETVRGKAEGYQENRKESHSKLLSITHKPLVMFKC